MMRYFTDNGITYQLDSGQYTQDEKQSLIDGAKNNDQLAQANAIIACAPAGSIQLTDEQIEHHKTGLYEWVDGKQVLKPTDNTVEIAALEASITARRWREALLGNEESIAFIAEVEAKIEVLR